MLPPFIITERQLNGWFDANFHDYPYSLCNFLALHLCARRREFHVTSEDRSEIFVDLRVQIFFG